MLSVSRKFANWIASLLAMWFRLSVLDCFVLWGRLFATPNSTWAMEVVDPQIAFSWRSRWLRFRAAAVP